MDHMFDVPRLDLPAPVVTALLAAAGVLIYGVAWRAVRPLPLLARLFARLLLALIVLLPFALMILMTADGAREASKGAPPQPPAAETAPAAPSGKAERPSGGESAGNDPGTERGPGREAVAEPERAAREAAQRADRADDDRRAQAAEEDARRRADQAAAESRQTSAEATPAAPPAVPPVAAPPVAAPPAAAPPAAGEPERTRGLAPPEPARTPVPALPPAPPLPRPEIAATPEPRPNADDARQPDWDVVPVFFGTDRREEPDPKRLQYGWERARKLAIGRALVTVPRAHQVPQVERPWTLRLPYFQVKIFQQDEDPKKHFTMRDIKAMTRDEFLAAVRERLGGSSRFKGQALVFVHGYNTGFDAAVYRTAQIAYDLKFDGAPFVYSWPSGGKVASYTYDRESAGQSEPHLRAFLEMVVKETGATSVSVIAHSMGNQPLLQVLKELKLQAPPGVSINQVISAAPDVDRDNFENIARAIQGFAKGVTLYAASNDRALIVSRRFHGGVPRAGDVPEQGPVVLHGVDTIDVSAASTDGLGINHSGYAENNTLLNDIGLLLQTGERPPDRRVPILEVIKTDRGAYWRYPRPR